MSYKLSICIPTFNRAKYLPELLDSIINQVDVDDPVEICISDNASTDSTKDVIINYQKEYPNIVYFRWSENMGADRNYLKCVEIAHGEYCWLMGSDDAITEGAIFKIFEYLKLNCDVLLCEAIVCDVNLQPNYRKKWLPMVNSDTVYNLKNDEDFIQYSFFAGSTEAFFSFISIIIFLREKWLSVECSHDVIGTAYSHVYMLLSFDKFDRFRLMYITQPFVYQRSYNDSFLMGDVAERTLLGLAGTELIARLLFFKNMIKYRCILWVLKKEMEQYISFKAMLFRKFFSKKETFALLQEYFRQLYGNKFAVKFFIVNLLHELPLFSSLLRRIIIFFRNRRTFINDRKYNKINPCL